MYVYINGRWSICFIQMYVQVHTKDIIAGPQSWDHDNSQFSMEVTFMCFHMYADGHHLD